MSSLPNSLTAGDPVTAAKAPTQKAAATVTARAVPKGWARAAPTKFPDAAWAKAVVMPQAGQGRLNIAIHPQAGRPSC